MKTLTVRFSGKGDPASFRVEGLKDEIEDLENGVQR